MSRLRIISVLIILVGILCCSSRRGSNREDIAPARAYISLESTWRPVLVHPGLILTHFDLYYGTVNHDGTEFFNTHRTWQAGVNNKFKSHDYALPGYCV